MSCFVCEPEVFKGVAKVCFQFGLRRSERGDYPLTLSEIDEFAKKVAELNCKNYAARYKEDEVSTDVEFFDDVPMEKITVHDIKFCDCWMYQTCDYYDEDPLFKMVAEAVEWAKLITKYSEEEYDEARWG